MDSAGLAPVGELWNLRRRETGIRVLDFCKRDLSRVSVKFPGTVLSITHKAAQI